MNIYKNFSFLLFFVLIIFTNFVFANTGSDLKISEVYFHGTKERIEIVNIGTGDFSGSLEIRSDATNDLIIPNFYIKSGGISVLGQTKSTDFFLDDFCFFSSSVNNFDVNDNGNSDIIIYHSGQVLDSVVLSGENKNYQNSLFRSGMSMLSTSQTGIKNTFQKFRMNPCYSSLIGQNTFEDRNSFLPLNSGLIISEVHFDGSREWIEITNTSNLDFNGEISFIGIGNTKQVYDTQINAKSVKVFKHSGVSYFTGDVDTEDKPLFNKMVDDKRLSISLFLGNNPTTGSLLDLFYRDVSYVNPLDDQKKSFEKIRNGTNFEITSPNTSRQYNVSDLNYTVNPGVVYDHLGNIIFPEQIIPPTPVVQSGLIEVTEINKTDGYNVDYIEFKVKTGFEGSILFSGLSIGNNFNWTNSFQTGGYYLVIAGNNPVNQNVKNLSTLSISDGLLQIYYSGVLQDSVLISNTNNLKTGQVLYRDGNNINKIGTGTPGLPKDFLPLIPRQEIIKTITNTVTETIYINNGGGGGGGCSCPVCPKKEDLCGTGNNQNSGSIVQSGQNLNQKIVSISRLLINPDGSDIGKEEIGLILNTGNFLNISGWILKYSDGKNFTFDKNSILSGGCENVFIGIATLVNSKDVCIKLFSGELLIDNVCYERNQKEKVFLSGYNKCGIISNVTGDFNSGDLFTGNIINTGVNQTGQEVDNNVETGQVVDYRQFDLSIKNILYDPKKQGGNSESITISLNNGVNEVAVSNLRLKVNDNKTYKTIGTGVLLKGKEKTFYKNFYFPNTKDSTIHLYYKSGKNYFEYDSFSYKIPLDEEDDLQTGKDEKRKNSEIRIRNIVYDPPGKDSGNEEIELEMVKGDKVDLKNFRLEVNGRNKKIYGILNPYQKKKLKGSFGFLNSKKTCVKIKREDFIFDTMCYDPQQNKQLTGTDIQTGDSDLPTTGQEVDNFDFSNIFLKIENIIYDPPGNDSGNEGISINYFSGKEEINLSDGFFLKIGSRHRSLKYFGNMKVGETKKLKGNFGFPNSKSVCVYLGNKNGGIVYDKFCYNPEEDKKLELDKKQKVDKQRKSTKSLGEKKFLGKTRLKKVDKKVCLYFDGKKVKCIFAPNYKVKKIIQKPDEENLLRVYNQMLERELMQNWKDLWYNSRLARYSKLYKDDKKILQSGKKYREYHGVKIDVFDLQTQYSIFYGRNQKQQISDFVTNLVVGKQGENIIWK